MISYKEIVRTVLLAMQVTGELVKKHATKNVFERGGITIIMQIPDYSSYKKVFLSSMSVTCKGAMLRLSRVRENPGIRKAMYSRCRMAAFLRLSL